jgi:hypothetical protein
VAVGRHVTGDFDPLAPVPVQDGQVGIFHIVGHREGDGDLALYR